MKIINPALGSLLLLSLSLLFACNKDEVPDTENETPATLTRADYYPGGTDTSGVAFYSDSIFYNDKDQVVKVVTHGTYDIVYLFTYNSNDLLSKMTARGSTWWNQDYNIFYGPNNRIDSLNMEDNSGTFGIFEMKSKLSYDGNNVLLSIATERIQEGSSYTIYKRRYVRKSNGEIDSINIQSFNQLAFSYENERNIHPATVVSPVNKSMQKFNPAYAFLLATRVQLYLFTSNSQNIFMQNILCPKDNLFNDGTVNRIYFSNQKVDSIKTQTYKNVCTLNADGSVKAFQYTELPVTASVNDFTVKCYYTVK
ncbi:hypothetical protein [Chitinophaga ginsengisoli]|uniref:DUF4595 domain-containing protein n=1 Tax=Chitinophaga ginsengisoli TaxID=363837 RepID=A0A2P8FN13_9BACT|nr:hypothetical protein [Chitinophaga ginsengisoli]PSL23045.1 hypothetical protein CLV42_11965 [Chitinophaga ginsengisoli]